jgi:hypothetical protein
MKKVVRALLGLISLIAITGAIALIVLKTGKLDQIDLTILAVAGIVYSALFNGVDNGKDNSSGPTV